MNFDKVYGGGAVNTISEISPKEIKRISKAEVAGISRE